MSQIVKNLKPMWEKKTSFIVDLFYRLNIKPNVLTFFGLVFILIGSFYILQNNLFIAGFFILIGNLIDSLDGYLARKYNLISKFGAFLDSVIDRYSDVLPIFALLYMNKNDDIFFSVAILSIIGSFMTSYTRARCEGLGFECKVGIFERPERSFFLIIGLLSGYIFYSLVIVAIGSNITAFQRILYFFIKNT